MLLVEGACHNARAEAPCRIQTAAGIEHPHKLSDKQREAHSDWRDERGLVLLLRQPVKYALALADLRKTGERHSRGLLT